MLTKLDTLHIKQSKEQMREGFDDCSYGVGYHIVDSSEKGRIMFCHSDKYGEFELDIDDIQEIYTAQHCDCLYCCYPKQQYLCHPEIAKKLHLLHPEIDKQMYSDIVTPHILILGSCDFDSDLQED